MSDEVDLSRAVADGRYAAVAGTMSAAKHFAVGFHAMPDDPAAAVDTAGRQGVNGTLEAIEGVYISVEVDLQRFVVFVATNFTSCHDLVS
jgi:hypothetical protein